MKEIFDKKLADKIRSELDSIQPKYKPSGWDVIQKELSKDDFNTKSTFFRNYFFYTITTFLLLIPISSGYQLFDHSKFYKKTSETKLKKPESGDTNLSSNSRDWEDRSVADYPVFDKKLTEKIPKEKLPVFTDAQSLQSYNWKLLETRDDFYSNDSLKDFRFSKNTQGNGINKNSLITLGTKNWFPPLFEENNKTSEAISSKKNFGLSFVFSPLLSYNFEGQLDYKRQGAEGGILFNYPLSGKLSFSSGFLLGRYSAKGVANPYEFSAVELNGLLVEEVAFKGKGEPPRVVELVTKEAIVHSMLVPLKINYQLGKIAGIKIFTSLSLNNYLNFEQYYTFNEEEFEIANPQNLPDINLLEFNREYFGEQYYDLFSTSDVSIGIEKELENKNSYVIEPFIRLPIKSMGAEKLKFRAVGISLKYNLNIVK